MGAIDFVQFSSSTFYLTETNTSLVKFTKSLEDCTTTNSLPAQHSISHIIQPPQLSQADSRIFLFFTIFQILYAHPSLQFMIGNQLPCMILIFCRLLVLFDFFFTNHPTDKSLLIFLCDNYRDGNIWICQAV